jgi:hypothetical protein
MHRCALLSMFALMRVLPDSRMSHETISSRRSSMIIAARLIMADRSQVVQVNSQKQTQLQFHWVLEGPTTASGV